MVLETMSNNNEMEGDVKSVKEYEPSAEEKKLVKKIEKMFAKAKSHRAKYDQDWLDYYHMFRGKQWKEPRPSYRHSEVINLVFQTIQSVIPIITDKRPKISYIPQEPQDQEFSEIANDVLDSDWTRQNWSEVITELLYDSHFYGTGITEMPFNPEAMNDLGQIELETKELFYFYVDPNARNINVKCRYTIYAEPMDIDLIKSKWPSKGKFVKPDLDEQQFEDQKTDLDRIKFNSPNRALVAYETVRPYQTEERKQALVITCYFDDKSFDEKEKIETDENGKQIKTFVQQKKFPGGRKVVISNGIVLQDIPNEYEDQKWPYQKLINYTLPREFYGESEVAQLAGPQKIFNKLVSFTLDVLTLMGNPIWVVDTNAGIDTDNLFNRPGLIVEKNPGSEVRRESGVQLQPYIVQIIDRMKVWFDQISGATDITRGVRPEGVQAGIAINSLMEAAQTRIRLKSRHLDSMLQDLGQAYLSRMFQFYTVPRIIRITNNQNATKYFRFQIDRDEETGEKKAIVSNFDQDDQGQFFESTEQEVIPIKGEFDVKVETGTQLPFARFEKENKLIQYYDRGIIDREEVLKNSELPNWEEILQRINEKEQALAQQQAQQQAQ